MIDVASQNQGQDSEKAPSDVDFVALRPGQKIGRYEITAILGQGGFGITYRARDSQLNRDVAIKEYLPTGLAVRQDGVTVLPRSTKVTEDFTWGRQRFVEEGRTLASLEHAPAIVQVFDFLEANGTAYIVMKLVPGETLENRIRKGTLSAPEIQRILWPLLDGMERVHSTNFLHRDIKPANILLDGAGNPTLIDFGASRAAMAGRTAAMTAIFTPGYAAAEQMTSAKQGPWTDIYGIAATIYHAIVGAPPPSAFDRMLDDTYKPLAQLAPAGFSPGVLIGLDAGLAVRASDRPQTIAGWRQILGQTNALDAQATVALARAPADPNATQMVRQPTLSPSTSAPVLDAAKAAAPSPAMRGMGLWIGLAVIVLALAGGGYWYVNDQSTRQAAAEAAAKEQAAREQAAKDQAARDQAARDQAERNQAELQKFRDQEAARQKAEEQRSLEEATRKKIEGELAEKQKMEEAQHSREAAALAEKQKAEEQSRKDAEAVESNLRLSIPDRQHIQVALTALGYNTAGTDGVFGQHTRDMIAAWQKARSYPATGFISGPQNQALMRDAAPAITSFDDEEKKKTEEAKKKADDEKAKTAAAAAAPANNSQNVTTRQAGSGVPIPSAASPAPPPPGTGSNSADGLWKGTYHCTPSKGGGQFTINFQVEVRDGTGAWHRPGSGPGTVGNQSVTLIITGTRVVFQRVYSPFNQAGVYTTATMTGQLQNGTITASGGEANSGGRTCQVVLTH